MTELIQRLSVPGTGRVLYPDEAMDAGTRGLIDVIDSWSWGGDIPATCEVGKGPKNYPLAEDGWTEDAADAGTVLDVSGGALQFSDSDDHISMPAGFAPTASDKHIGLIWWMRNSQHPSANGFNNSIFGHRDGSSNKFSLTMNYDSSAISFVCEGASAWSKGMSNSEVAAMFDGNIHQFGYEVERTDDGKLRQRIYLDGKLASDRGVVSDSAGGWSAPDTASNSRYADLVFGRHPHYNGTGMSGGLYRAMMQQLDVSGARSFSETVALDYRLNAARIQSA